MNKRNFFKLVGGVMGSMVVPSTQAAAPYKPFNNIYNKFYTTYVEALAGVITAEIDRDMILRMLKIVIESDDPTTIGLNVTNDSQKIYAERINILETITFDIVQHKKGFRIKVNDPSV